MSTISKFCIDRVVAHEEVEGLLHSARKEMFLGRMDPDNVPFDLQNFERNYLCPEGCMLLARQDQASIGSIGYRSYDGRFPHLALPAGNTVEVARLFILPQWRRQGVASQLFTQLVKIAMAQGVRVLYLHTHPFLVGAVEFWQSLGFEILERDPDPLWQTIHMVCCIEDNIYKTLVDSIATNRG